MFILCKRKYLLIDFSIVLHLRLDHLELYDHCLCSLNSCTLILPSTDFTYVVIDAKTGFMVGVSAFCSLRRTTLTNISVRGVKETTR